MSDDKAMAAAMRILTRRGHSTQEIRQKLFDRGFSAGEVKHVISECLRLHFLDDSQLAKDYLVELQQKGCGNFKIKMMLRKKGISDDIISETIGEAKENELDYADHCFNQKLKALRRETDRRKLQEKMFRFMFGRGFSTETVKILWSKMIKATSTTEE